MSWRDWPSWFWGGIITSIVFVIFEFIKDLLFKRASWIGEILILDPISKKFFVSSQGFLNSDFMLVFSSAIVYFLLGSIIGGITWKIKEKVVRK